MTSLESTSAGCGLATIAAVVASTVLAISTAEDSARTEATDAAGTRPQSIRMPVMMMSGL